MIDTAAVHHFASPLLQFRRAHPEVDLKLEVSSSAELAERLSDGLLDLVVMVDHTSDDSVGEVDQLDGAGELLVGDYFETPLLVEELHAYAPPGVAVGDVSQWGPWVTFPASSRTRAHIARALRRSGTDFEVVAETSQPAVLREMVQLGMGWTVLAPIDAEREPHALQRASKTPVAHRRLILKRRAGTDVTPPVARLSAVLLESVGR